MIHLTRRTLLVDLGRATLGAVVLGGVATGCADDASDDGAATTGAESSGGDGGTTAATSGDGEETGAAGSAFQRASFGFVSAYVLVRDGEALVFDTGTGDDIAPVAGALEAAGVGWDAVGHVVVSHGHSDHVGGIELVAAEAPAATTYAAVPDLDAFRDRAPNPQEVADGDRVLDLSVVATPGHTPGHISLHDEAGRLLLVGDALVNGAAIGGNSGEGVELSPPDFTADADAAAASGALLAGLAFDIALFGHGEPITGRADEVVAADIG